MSDVAGSSAVRVLMLLCAVEGGSVLNPAGASVAAFAVTLASPVPNKVNAAKRQEERRTFLQWGVSMSASSKRHQSPARADASWLIH